MNEAVAHAIDQARKCVETFRHGAVLLEGSRIVATGRNRNQNACGLMSIHAEMDAAWKVKPWSASPSHVVVVRLRRDRAFGYSRPCPACLRALRKKGVRKMTYTTGDPACPLVTECW